MIQGNVAANTGVTNTLRLGGDTNASFDVSTIGPQYQNFNVFEKNGASTWTLIGHGQHRHTLDHPAGHPATRRRRLHHRQNVTNNGALAFNRTDAFTFANVVSGTDPVSQIGTRHHGF